MKIKETVKAFFSDPKKDIQAILPQLISLKKEIEKIQNMSNKVEGVVKLFQVISPLQDARAFSKTIISLEKKDYGQLNRQITALTVLRSHINNAGRSEYGWNRTCAGESVDASKIFLGNCYGIWTKTAAYWLQHEEENKKDFRPDVSKNPDKPVTTWHLINDCQCGDFLKSHVDGILKQIFVLQSAAV